MLEGWGGRKRSRSEIFSLAISIPPFLNKLCFCQQQLCLSWPVTLNTFNFTIKSQSRVQATSRKLEFE